MAETSSEAVEMLNNPNSSNIDRPSMTDQKVDRTIFDPRRGLLPFDTVREEASTSNGLEALEDELRSLRHQSEEVKIQAIRKQIEQEKEKMKKETGKRKIMKLPKEK